MGHNHVRGAQGSTSAVTMQGRIIATKTNTQGSSAKREFVNLKAHLDELESAKVDIASCTVDQNPQSMKEITSRVGLNAENPHCRNENIQCLHKLASRGGKICDFCKNEIHAKDMLYDTIYADPKVSVKNEHL